MCTERVKDLVSFRDAEDLVQEFKHLLQLHGIAIGDGSEQGIASNTIDL